jgi:hypothetical protein
MKEILKLFFILLVMSSCSTYRYPAKIMTGGYSNGIIRDTVLKANEFKTFDVDGDSYVRYGADSVKSNTVELSLYKKVPAKLSFKGFKVWYIFLAPVAPFIGIYYIINPPPHAYATIDKSFYKNHLYYVADCPSGDCRNTTYSVKVLMNIEVRCRKEQINDTITLTDNLPIGAKLNSFSVIKGEDKVSKVIHSQTLINGQECHTYKIVGQGGTFKKRKTKIKILQDISFTTLDIFYQ